MEFLVVAGCDLAQGYYFSTPLEPAEMKEWFRRLKPRRGPARLRIVGSAQFRLSLSLALSTKSRVCIPFTSAQATKGFFKQATRNT
jgi:hypothetical protein